LQQHLVNYCKLLHHATLVRQPEHPEQYLVTPVFWLYDARCPSKLSHLNVITCYRMSRYYSYYMT